MAPTVAAPEAAETKHGRKAVALAALDPSGHLAPLTVTRRLLPVHLPSLYYSLSAGDIRTTVFPALIKPPYICSRRPTSPPGEIRLLRRRIGDRAVCACRPGQKSHPCRRCLETGHHYSSSVVPFFLVRLFEVASIIPGYHFCGGTNLNPYWLDAWIGSEPLTVPPLHGPPTRVHLSNFHITR